MLKSLLSSAALTLLAVGSAAAQTAPVDFARDVAPLLRQNCIGCHGPSQQNGGLRIDRRSSVEGARRVVPGGIENSILYHRLIGDPVYGPQMPPTGALKPEQLATIKGWIEQGAVWPEALANEADLPPPNARAVAVVDAMRRGDKTALMAASADLLNARGPDGATPFMYAVLFTDAATLTALVKRGANVNAQNDAHATALMWAAPDIDKTRALVDAGAQVNAVSDDHRTPLMIAATRPGNVKTVKLLLDRGANVNPTAHPGGESSPLIQAATMGDAAMVQLLIERGANVNASAQQALSMSIATRCDKCVALLTAQTIDKDGYTGALLETAFFGNVNAIRTLLDHGADVNAVDPTGRTPLMYAAVSDFMSVDAVSLLVARGANVNAVNGHKTSGDAGMTVLDIARFHGDTPIVDALRKAGAKESRPAALAPQAAPRTVGLEAAVNRSLPQLQRSDSNFIAKAGCFSCHNNSISALAVGTARARGFTVNESLSAKTVTQNLGVLGPQRDHLRQGFFAPVEDIFGPFVLGYLAVGLHAEHYEADLNTDAVAMYLRMHQMTDGHWEYGFGDSRPPLCQQYIGQTVLAMRALQLYAPAVDKAGYEAAIKKAAAWLASAEPKASDDLGWKLLGLAWAAADKNALKKTTNDMLALQRQDGGWAAMPSMASDAYATGKALVALEAAGVPTDGPTFQRGIRFLLDTQHDDGSWYVRSRALAFQPYFDNGFPHEYDQWISSAATGWATTALTLAAPAPARRTQGF